jgi:hypothetical protein
LLPSRPAKSSRSGWMNGSRSRPKQTRSANSVSRAPRLVYTRLGVANG